jgi:NAD-dependent DNA ligase
MMVNHGVSKMTAAQAKTRHAELAAEIRRHDHLYYVQARPSISDQEYDRLYRELADLEKEFPELVTPESPTQRVGGQPVKSFAQVAHLQQMLSLDNTYSQARCGVFSRASKSCFPTKHFPGRLSRRLTDWQLVCATKTASSASAPRAATEPWATTSLPISKRFDHFQ